MSTDLMVKNDVVSRVWNKIDKIAKAKGMTQEEFIAWSEAERCRSNISDYEHNLIFAYQLNKAIKEIERLKISDDRGMLAEATLRDYSWISGFKDDFIKVGKAIKHLQEVCKYVKDKEDNTYQYKWLLSYDDVLFDEIIEGSKGKNKKGKPKRDYQSSSKVIRVA
ncbi:hypothetical protein ES695_17350 [Candidatus Atribacteria bacterium 1244-E10-H5-B2]|nr:MAG: hypothetical protein ES695_17350 [Candidatus Atribacteria bacterium 1244-E10-H5-B2]